MSKSSKYLVHLNTFLCEGSMVIVNKSRLGFLSFHSFCRHYALLIEKKQVGEHEAKILKQIYEYVNPYLNLTYDEFINYLYEFMKLEPQQIMIYQRMVTYRKQFSID